MAEGSPSKRHVVVQFGRDVTDDDLRRMQQDDDVVEARMIAEDVVDEDHVHVHPS